MLKVLDLFSGIGGFSLGLERTGGFETVAFCEIEPFQRSVLAKHWPGVKCYPDVRELSAQHLTADGIVPDVICGGFPCQDISIAGKGAGLAGERSGLWSDFARLICELRPHFVIVENVSALLGRGLGDVLGDLAALGYDAEWHCIPASAVGAPHQRDRVWIMAYPRCERGFWGTDICTGNGVANGERSPDGGETVGASFCGGSDVVADADHAGREWSRSPQSEDRRGGAFVARRGAVRQPSRTRLAIGPGTLGERAHATTTGAGWWATEPDVGRVVDGPAGKVDRRKRLIALGNGVVPQIPELIGRAILAAMECESDV